MGIVFRQSVKTTIVILIGSVLGGVLIILGTYMVPDKQQLGFTRNLTTQAALLSQLLLFGLHGTLSVFIHKYDEKDKRRQMLITICTILPVVFVAIGTLFYAIFREQVLTLFQPQDIPFIKQYFMWLPLFVFFFVYQVLLEQYLGSQMKLAIATFMKEVVLRVLNLAIILLFGYGYIGFDKLVAGTVLIYAVPSLVLFFLSLRTRGFGFTSDTKAFTKAEYKEIIHFAWYHTLLSVSISLMGFIDSLMLASIDKDGLSSVPVYSIAVFVMSVLVIPYRAMASAAFPDLAKGYKDNDMGRVANVYSRSSINIFITSVAMILLIGCNLANIVAVLPEGFEAVSLLVLIMLIGRLADTATGMNDQLVTVSPYYKFNFYMSIVLVALMIIFNMILIPHYGYYGAAWATSIALALYNLGKYIFVYTKMKIQPFSKGTLLTIAAAVPALATGYFFPRLFSQVRHIYVNTALDASVRSLAIIVVYALMLIWLKPSADLETYIASIRKNKRLF